MIAFDPINIDEAITGYTNFENCKSNAVTFDPIDINYEDIISAGVIGLGLPGSGDIPPSKTSYRKSPKQIRKRHFDSTITAVPDFRRRSLTCHLNSQLAEFLRIDFNKRYNRKLVRVTSLSSKLVRPNVIYSFPNECAKIWEAWTLLLYKTALLPSIASSDPYVTAVFKAVNSIISKT